MSRIKRLSLVQSIMACAVAATLLAGTPGSMVGQPETPGCDQFSNALGTFHAFVGGACYQGAPNAKHTNWQNGYCHEWHYTCS